MTAVPKPRKLTEQEYLAIENAAEFKSEFFDGEMFAMAGGSPAHAFIKDNVNFQIRKRIDDGPCRMAASDLRVKVNSTGLYTYPDIVIVCGELELDPDDRNTILNPRVIVEILSPSTERYDRTTKFRHYQQIPSAREYILVSQDEALVEQFVLGDDGKWPYFSYAGLDATFSLESVPAKDIPLADVYRGITFPERVR